MLSYRDGGQEPLCLFIGLVGDSVSLCLPAIALFTSSSATLTFTWQSRTGIARHLRPEPLIHMIVVATRDVD